ncbi:hypothetical protein IJJ39_01430 [Candidatus Saccharibacteria bacterium]|nr:hypothetical protein [Candidatus Saccharibacteria bacterium]
MGKNKLNLKIKLKTPKPQSSEQSTVTESSAPVLARRSMNRKSYLRSGRTIAEKRERLETASERLAAHKKIKREKTTRTLVVMVGFLVIVGIIGLIASVFINHSSDDPESSSSSSTITVPYAPTIEVIDEDTGSSTAHITARMKEYIGQAEVDFRELGYTPVKAVIPTGAIREVDFYLSGHTGFIKLIIDRETGVSVEDADRMIRYLEGQGITDYQYIDVRLDGKAYWK